MTRPRTPATRRRRWPLLAIGASAGTATWSGWVGLGELTGFGVVHPLPGIWDDLTLNTAVTLPVGVEAYAMYALSIATSSRQLATKVRRYAWASSAAALALGMAGQVAYHVMTAHGRATGPAPWWVTALVSCLPVLVLGAASLLWHLAGEIGPADPVPAPAADAERSDPVPLPESDPAIGPAPLRIVAALSPPPQIGATASTRTTAPTDRGARGVGSGAPVAARPDDIQRVRDAIANGDLPAQPTAAAIRTLLAISPAYARAARDAIHATPPEPDPNTRHQQNDEQIPGQEHIDLFTSPSKESSTTDP